MTRLILLITALAASLTSALAESAINPAYYDYRIVNAYPHDETAFTQGLFFDSGVLVESTGKQGQSSIRKVNLETGEILERTNLPDKFFGEGIALADNQIVSLTWRAQKGFVFDRQSLSLIKNFSYDGEGWGITHDGAHFIMSDGTSTLRLLDTDTLKVTATLDVTFRGKPLTRLNELEWIDGEIFANIWQTNAIVRIDPNSGAVTGVIDLRGLLPKEDFTPGQTDVLNGIAYDPEAKRLFVTGKNWPKLFEIELVERTQK
jgi:glutaminyl-peptide cyclotransferase